MFPIEIRTFALNTTIEPIKYPMKENNRIHKYYANLTNK